MIAFLLFIAGLVIGGLISWGITHSYHKKASAEQERLLKKASAEQERLLAQFSEDLNDKNTLEYFQHLLETSEWEKQYIDGKELWISQSNNIYQIERGERGNDFSEPWTDVHPNPNCARYPVYLKIGDTIIKELEFIAVDEGRIFVPIPEQELIDDERRYTWYQESLDVIVCRIIGKYHVYKNLSGVARRSGVELVP